MRPPARPRPPRRDPEPDDGRPDDGRPDDDARPAAAPPAAPEPRRLARRRPADSATDRPAGTFTQRLTERYRAQRRLRWRAVLITLGIVAAVGVVGWAVLLSPLLALDTEQVTITGTGEGTTVATADVAAVVDRHAGTPLPRLDAPGMRSEVEQLATVRSAEVHREWPRGLTIDVVAREPVAALRTEEAIELLDADGVTVATVEEVPEGMAQVDVPRSGERAPQTLTAVLAVLAELPPAVRADVAVAVATGPGAIVLELHDGAEVRWGGAEESELKAAVLEVLRSEPAAVYDVTVPRSPTTSD
ncbi:cell division protein FtsQ/DivIB [Georgenia sunbinii]|uniref:cell division protein FtsQ/DivIB n=1 Tax=Georgenia sunbinii TaxID=3117728 RepID=UPI002F2658FF